MKKPVNKIEKLIAEMCPDGVEFKTLGEIVEILDSQRKPITKSKRESGNIPYYGANGIQDYVKDYIFDGTFLLMGEDGSVINKDGSPVLNWATGKIWVNNHAHIMSEIYSGALLRFLYFYLQIINVTKMVRGVPPKINQRNLKAIQIPIPPLAIQKEIVKILDNFTKLEAELEARKMQYEHYRDELLISIRDIKWTKLEKICDVRDGTHDSPIKSSEGMPLVTSKNIKNNDIDLSTSYLISASDFEKVNKRSKVDKWDVLISMIGTVGETAVIYRKPNFAIKNVGLVKVGNELLAKFISYYLKSHQAKNHICSIQNGSTQKFLSLSMLRNFPIPVPPLTEQKRIVSILDKFDALVSDISIGLPAEIAARKKQYEYYRNQLLTFSPSESVASIGGK